MFGYDKQNHLVLNIVDCDKPKFFADEMIEEAIKYIIDALNKGRKVSIHCNQGESRAPSIALMVLRKLKLVDSDFNKTVNKFISKYPSYKPGQGIYQYMQMKWNNL